MSLPAQRAEHTTPSQGTWVRPWTSTTVTLADTRRRSTRRWTRACGKIHAELHWQQNSAASNAVALWRPTSDDVYTILSYKHKATHKIYTTITKIQFHAIIVYFKLCYFILWKICTLFDYSGSFHFLDQSFAETFGPRPKISQKVKLFFFVWTHWLAERLAETKLWTERSLNPKLINSPADFACTR